MHKRYIVDLEISPQAMLRYYSGAVGAVVAHARDGKRVRFPAEILRPFVEHAGVRGTFALSVDKHDKLQRIERI